MTSRRERADRNSLPMLLAQARHNHGVRRSAGFYVGVAGVWAEVAEEVPQALNESDDGSAWNDAYHWRPGDRVL